ncbi:TonB family protein [Brevundimonas variabilis]|uniref:TonB family protein n=1 Tax=Brevundimonas variabilis TaxID=74312 RepID=A0A7W9CGG4_9CAUL|nr:TonB family protein [Brevundimonas variabilis]MBB5745207.1 TonB family protein [Brevundimonas variabilis]
MIELIIAVALFIDPAVTAATTPAKGQVNAASFRERSEEPVLQGVAVTLECTARVTGRVEACKVLEETHPGMGFGQAALTLMQDVEVEPPRTDIRFARTIVFTP